MYDNEKNPVWLSDEGRYQVDLNYNHLKILSPLNCGSVDIFQKIKIDKHLNFNS